MSDDESKTINVTSYNQQGGITAGTVNIEGPPPRDLNKISKAEVDGLLAALEEHRGKFFLVSVQIQDAESLNFANQIISLMQDDGFDVNGSPGTIMGGGMLPPLSINSPNEKRANVAIGANNPNYPD